MLRINYNITFNFAVFCAFTDMSVVSFKINDTTYKTTVKVYKYTNPIKTLKITGIKNGKNQYSRFKNKYTTSVTLKKNWKIMDIQVHESPQKNTSPVSFTALNYHKGKTSAKFRLNTLKAKNTYHIMILMQNKKTKGNITCEYRINQ